MKLLIWFTIFISSLAYAKDNSWSLSFTETDLKLYQFNNDPNITGTYQVVPGKLPANFETAVAELTNQKRITLSAIGITNWQVTRYLPSPSKRGYVIEGTYYDPTNRLTEFREEHVYENGKIVQYLNTWPSTFSEGLSKAQEFVAQMKKDVKQ